MVGVMMEQVLIFVQLFLKMKDENSTVLLLMKTVLGSNLSAWSVLESVEELSFHTFFLLKIFRSA